MIKHKFLVLLLLAPASFLYAQANPFGGEVRPWYIDEPCVDDNHVNFHECALEAAENFEPPRTLDGVPDMSGIWRRRSALHESILAHPVTLDDFGGPTGIVSTDNGLVPIQDWAEAKRRYNRSAYVHHNAICQLDGIPTTMYMTGTYQFMQSPGQFLVQGEEAHAFRMIDIDRDQHIGAGIRLWNGDSIGYWEGNTLVVETRNQNARPWLDQRGRFYTNEALMTERFTMIGPNTIHWAVTVDDPNVYTEPFTISLAYRRSRNQDTFEVWEEACYEDNAFAEQMFQDIGYDIYKPISGEEARRLSAAWDLENGELEDLEETQ